MSRADSRGSVAPVRHRVPLAVFRIAFWNFHSTRSRRQTEAVGPRSRVVNAVDSIILLANATTLVGPFAESVMGEVSGQQKSPSRGPILICISLR